MEAAIVVLTTTGTEEQALTIAEELLQQELTACVNIMPTMRSIYRFKGKVFDDEENLLIIKSTVDLYDQIATVIKQLHTYEIPEIVAFEIDKCKDDFLSWINDNVKGARKPKKA